MRGKALLNHSQASVCVCCVCVCVCVLCVCVCVCVRHLIYQNFFFLYEVSFPLAAKCTRCAAGSYHCAVVSGNEEMGWHIIIFIAMLIQLYV